MRRVSLRSGLVSGVHCVCSTIIQDCRSWPFLEHSLSGHPCTSSIYMYAPRGRARPSTSLHQHVTHNNTIIVVYRKRGLESQNFGRTQDFLHHNDTEGSRSRQGVDCVRSTYVLRHRRALAITFLYVFVP